VTGLVGGEPDRGDLGVGEHDPGDPVVPGGALTAQNVVSDDPALVVGDVGEHRHPGDVPERPQAGSGLAMQPARGGLSAGAHADDDHVELVHLTPRPSRVGSARYAARSPTGAPRIAQH